MRLLPCGALWAGAGHSEAAAWPAAAAAAWPTAAAADAALTGL